MAEPNMMDPFEIPVSLEEKFSVMEGKFNPEQVKFLVYGESGVGKTVFASTWPTPVFLDIDHGMASVRRTVHRLDIDSWESLLQSLDWLMSGQHPFKTVVLDSLNELQYLTMRHVVNTFQVRRPYDSLPALADYGKMMDDFEKKIRDLKSLPLNVILIAQVAPRAYETDPVQPQLTGKQTARNLSRMMDEIGYLDKKDSSEGGNNSKTRFMTFDAVNHVTKDRSWLLPPIVEDPTYEELYKYWSQSSIRS
jgi:hypothetical protein